VQKRDFPDRAENYLRDGWGKGGNFRRKFALDLFCRFLLIFNPLGLRFLQFRSPLILSSPVRRFPLALVWLSAGTHFLSAKKVLRSRAFLIPPVAGSRRHLGESQMSRLLNLAVCLFVVTSASGCCLMGCGGGYSPYGGGCSPCQTGACGAAAPGYPSAGMYNPNIPATAYAAPVNGAYGPQMVQVDQLRTF
jgi:hypothetical protein